eukprot:NODE_3_length_80033_cov_0.932970.p73 type:complete len:110 gc:universal NODE_3_length_80033_cov_0.932970:65368-65697(+)
MYASGSSGILYLSLDFSNLSELSTTDLYRETMSAFKLLEIFKLRRISLSKPIYLTLIPKLCIKSTSLVPDTIGSGFKSNSNSNVGITILSRYLEIISQLSERLYSKFFE